MIRTRTPLIIITVLTTVFSIGCLPKKAPVEGTREDPRTRDMNAFHIVEECPEPGHMTVMSQWITSSIPPAAIVFKVGANKEIQDVTHRKGEPELWKPLIDRFCRSEYAYRGTAALISAIPHKFQNKNLTEEDLFAYLPYLRLDYKIRRIRTISYGNLPGYCEKHSKFWQERLDHKKLIVVDYHSRNGKAPEGYILLFSDDIGGASRHLTEIYRLADEESTLFYRTNNSNSSE
ncbi:hypothetical protein ACFLU6_13245 [Acidobacteriota bacterium]